MKAFLASLGSRKFLVALGTLAALVANHQYTPAAAVAVAYVAAEAHIDAKSVVAAVDGVAPLVKAADPVLAPVVDDITNTLSTV